VRTYLTLVILGKVKHPSKNRIEKYIKPGVGIVFAMQCILCKPYVRNCVEIGYMRVEGSFQKNTSPPETVDSLQNYLS
jgi:hypothetical protein